MAARLTIDQAARHFELHNRTENKSPRTVSWHNQVLNLFVRFLEERGHSRSLEVVSEREVREFILHLQEKKKYSDNPYFHEQDKKLSAYTVQNRVRSLKAFFAWLEDEGYTEENRLARLRVPKAPQKVAPVLSEDDVRRVLAAIDQDTILGVRAYAVLVTLLNTGLRCSSSQGFFWPTSTLKAPTAK